MKSHQYEQLLSSLGFELTREGVFPPEVYDWFYQLIDGDLTATVTRRADGSENLCCAWHRAPGAVHFAGQWLDVEAARADLPGVVYRGRAAA